MRGLHALAALLLMVSARTVAAQVPADLTQAIKARDQAVGKVDVPAWERLTATGFTVVDDNGHRFTRAERLTDFKKTKPAGSPGVCGQERTAMFANGTTATRTCLIDGTWWLDVWVKGATGWQVVAVQGTRAAK